ncbi:hypothetical protein ACIBJF_18035 [Streptomyces sp. NPDC050743]|uniref:hypothetical protein n=1 Tax=Streptomyces sp. NPDC050743 TaxID=3365634 RepID=UPI00378A293A
MSVLLEDSADSIVSTDVETSDPVLIFDLCGKCAQRRGVAERPVGSMPVVEVLELAQYTQELPLVPGQGAVQQLATAGLTPSLEFRCRRRTREGGENAQASHAWPSPVGVRVAGLGPVNVSRTVPGAGVGFVDL